MEGTAVKVKSVLVPWLILTLFVCLPSSAADRPIVLLVVGAPGSDEYGKQFQKWAGRWQEAAGQGDFDFAAVGFDEEGQLNDQQRLRRRLTEEATNSRQELWLVLIGHGTFDGRTAKFNLRGPDVSASELAEWLRPFTGSLAVVNCASASGPFINALSAPNRVVIAATKSGHEHNFARFGDYFSAAIGDSSADLDKDRQTSLLEAFLLAAARVEEFYADGGRLATEHALIDDNGDQLGTPAAWFEGVRAVKVAKNGANPDGVLAGQRHLLPSSHEQRLTAEARSRRDALEREIAQLRLRKGQLSEEEYYRHLEPLAVELAKLYAESDEKAPSP